MLRKEEEIIQQVMFEFAGKNASMVNTIHKLDFPMVAYEAVNRLEKLVIKKNADGLLPCPFCKSEPQIASLGGDEENWIVLCPNCQRASVEMGVAGAETKEDCMRLWNERL